MEYNEKKFSIEAAIEKGRPLPEWYLDEPELIPGDDFFLSAFHQLSTERQIGDVPGSIPWSKIVQYSDRRGLEPDVSVLLEHVIMRMDSAYIQWFVDKQKKLKKGTKSG